MALWTLALAALFAAEQAAESPPASSSQTASAAPAAPASAEPGFHDYQRRISELLKRESQAKSSAARAAIVRGMCEQHGQIVHDSRYLTSDVLKEYRSRLWSRLSKIKTELRQQLARSQRTNDSLDTLATLEQADAVSLAAADSLAASLSLISDLQGGVGATLARGGAPGPVDLGPELVELIERTINPSFWDVVGGPGSILYYRPLQCLVVRATAEVHANLGGLVGGLRDAR